MNKKIVLSVATIAVVAAAAIGGTVAYFSDVEKSTGNVIVTGSIDLKVDHTRQTYNGVDCKTCNVEVVSDTTNMVVAKNGVSNTPYAAALVTPINSAWTAVLPSGASWIWATNPTTSPADTQNDVTYTFEKKFQWMGPAAGAVLTLGVAADNSYEVKLNGVQKMFDNGEYNFTAAGQDSVTLTLANGDLNQGTNTLDITVKNWKQANGTSATNPGGLAYKLAINGNCGDDYFKTHCQLWDAANLSGQKFFNFDDIKPGDWGTDVISLHVYNNPAWACMSVAKDSELSDANEQISNEIYVKLWRDSDGDGIWDDGELSLGGPMKLADLKNVGLFDAATAGGAQLPANSVQYVGITWCAGEFMQDGNCSPIQMGNEAQGQKYGADVILEAIQTRHNDGYVCSQNTGTEPDLEGNEE